MERVVFRSAKSRNFAEQNLTRFAHPSGCKAFLRSGIRQCLRRFAIHIAVELVVKRLEADAQLLGGGCFITP